MSIASSSTFANSLQSSVAKLSARLSENLHESARDLGLTNGLEGVVGGGGASARALVENGTLSTEEGIRETRKLLESPRDREREEGLKRVLALMAKGRPVTSFFPFVTNCLSSSSVIVRSLVSLYVVRQAALEPDLALLSVNMYQKDLGDPNPVVRAMALRVLSGMGLEAIAGLVAMCLKRSSRDGSWHVRRATAAACGRLLQLDKAHKTTLVPIVETLLADRSPLVIGSAAAAFDEVCPDRLDLLHQRYRTLCRLLVDADEWGQVALLRLLARYARLHFLDPNRPKDDPARAQPAVDPDLDLLLRSCEPLFLSHNHAVVASAVKVYYHLGPSLLQSRVIRPYLRLLHSSPEIQHVVLDDLLEIASHQPDLLSPYLTSFYVRVSDTPSVRRSKLRCLAALATSANVRSLLRELLEYVHDYDEDFAGEAIRAIGRCATALPEITAECLDALLGLAKGRNEATISQAVVVIGALLGSAQASGTKLSRQRVVGRLVRLLQTNRLPTPAARANVYWLVGQHADEGLLESIAPDTLRWGVRSFSEEVDVVKLSLLNLGARLLLASYQSSLSAHTPLLSLLFDHLSTLARYDLSYEVRDRARFLRGLVTSCGVGSGSEGRAMPVEAFSRGEEAEVEHVEAVKLGPAQVHAILFASKRSSISADANELIKPEARPLAGWSYLSPWATTRSDPALRDNPGDAPPSRPASTTPTNGVSSAASARRNFSSSPSPGGSGRSSPVVLTPASSTPTHRAPARPRDLNTFLASDDEESEEEDEDDSEEEDESEEEEASDDDEASDDEEEEAEATERTTGGDEIVK